MGFTQRHHRKFQRKTAGFKDAAFDELRQLAQVAVAGRQLRPGVADADDRAAVELIVRIALVLDPAAVQKAALAFVAEPGLAAARRFFVR
jgi:hypothetical protein